MSDTDSYDERVRFIASLIDDSPRSIESWMITLRSNAEYWVRKGAIDTEDQYFWDMLKELERRVNG